MSRDNLTPPSCVSRFASALALLLVFSQMMIPANAAAAYTITLQTDSTSYSGAQPIRISGAVSPAPGPNTAVVITIRNSAGNIADINEVFPSPADGSFTDVSYPGGSAAWTSGTFSVNATWGGNGATASQVVTFAYSPTATSTTTSTTSTTSTTTTTTTTSSTTSSTTTSASTTTSTTTATPSTTKTTSTTSSTTTSTTTSPPAATVSSTTTSTSTVVTKTTPEFPTGVLAIVALVALALVAALSRKTQLRHPGNVGR